MTTIVILLLLLTVAVSNIAAHVRINRLLRRVEQLNLARRDEIHDLRQTLRAFEIAAKDGEKTDGK